MVPNGSAVLVDRVAAACFACLGPPGSPILVREDAQGAAAMIGVGVYQMGEVQARSWITC